MIGVVSKEAGDQYCQNDEDFQTKKKNYDKSDSISKEIRERQK